MDNGLLVNSSLSSKAGTGALSSARSNHSSPTASTVPSMPLQGCRSPTPHGLRTARTEAYSTGIFLLTQETHKGARDAHVQATCRQSMWFIGLMRLRRRVPGHALLQRTAYASPSCGY